MGSVFWYTLLYVLYFVDHFFGIYVTCLSYFRFYLLKRCGLLLVKGWPLDSLVCYVFIVFCHFPVWCTGSGVVLDCIDS